MTKVWKNNNTIWAYTLSEIESSREIYNRNKDWILLYQEELRNKIYNYYLNSSKVVHALRYFLNRKIEINALAIKQTISNVQKENPNLSSEQIGQINSLIASTILSDANLALENKAIDKSLSEHINELQKLAQEAGEIRLLLDKIKKHRPWSHLKKLK